ncbi:endogenous retrovirus group K member 8 Gag polyprotein-like [Phaenicophaeus curvirostris]|uniref:endogenous retrovirus group K member 8 Gag polyprotein-like n=1 Tax=Phaenicophaeus curvirostris TaxID=33595 RepID=UPI0037F09F39
MAAMLTGQGQYADTQIQITFPADMLRLSARLALEAFLNLPGPSAPSFGNLVQGATEDYAHFVDRLWETVMNHPDLSPESKEQMFKVLAFDNANKATKQILAGLPKEAGVEEMLLRVERAESHRQTSTIAAAVQSVIREITQPTAAVARKQKYRDATSSSAQPFRGKCYRCGNEGHVKKNCRATLWCDNCQRPSHATKACAGNGGPSADRGRVRTQMNPLQTYQPKNHVFYSNTSQQPEGAWESTWRPQ